MANGQLKKVATVVVGVDGSAGAAEALRWAVVEARLRKARLRIVHSWTFGNTGMPLSDFAVAGGFEPGVSLGIGSVDLQRAAEEALLERAIGEVAEEVEAIEIDRQVVEGRAAQVLISAAVDADLLVVGSRGHGGFVGLMLGSVSQQCVGHASCPVVVVRSPEATANDHELARASATESAAAV